MGEQVAEANGEVDWSAMDTQLQENDGLLTEKPAEGDDPAKLAELEALDLSGGSDEPAKGDKQKLDAESGPTGERGENQESGAAADPIPDDKDGSDPAAADPDPNDGIDFELMIHLSDELGDLTVGQMKDQYQEIGRREKSVIEKENELMTERHSLSELLETMQPVLGAASVNKQKAIRQRRLQKEHALLMDNFPEWKDPGVKQKASDAMRETLTSYGFTDQEYESLGDHRIIKLLNDHTLSRTRLETARQNLNPERKLERKRPSRNAGKRRRGSTDKMVANATASKSRDVKMEAIDQLLR